MKIVIRAGGTGTRLWPLSRRNRPKQFQKILGDESLIRSTYLRVKPLLIHPDDAYVSTNAAFVSTVREELPEINDRNIIVESDTKNTGPAMCLEVCYLSKTCSDDEVIASIPSDDYISDAAAFCDLLRVSEEFIHEHPSYILTPAVKPQYPDTGYTYFKAGKNLQPSGEEAIYEIADVAEKPSDERLGELLTTGVYFAHTGMYVWRLGHITEVYRKFQPHMFELCDRVASKLSAGEPLEAVREVYSQLEAMSVETAVTDKIEHLAMSVSNRIGWSDVGKWHVIKRILESGGEENVSKGAVVTKSSTNNLLYSLNDRKIIVANDVRDLAVIDTGDALFISSLKNSADVREIVERMKKEGMEKYI